MQEVIRRADDAGEPLIGLLGHTAYYPRFGFERATAIGIATPWPMEDDAAFMVRRLRGYDASCRGKFRYAWDEEEDQVITVDDYLFYVDDALDGMIEIVASLGDSLANKRPDIADANSPYVLLTHCLGVMEWWGGHVVAGRKVSRDRDAEFRAAGPVVDLVERARVARRQLAADLETYEASAPPRGYVPPEDADHPLARTQGAVLMHIYEELAQHRGQMEGCRDLLLAPWAKLV